jgi:hypothetical protein
MRVIRYALIAILLLSAGSARAQQLREIPRITNRHAAWQKRVLQRPKAASAQPQQATAVPGLEEPAQLAFDPSGNLYIADPTLQQVLKVTPQGVVSVFAGTGDAGFTGDGGPAVDATLEDPFGVAVDASGHVFIADTENNVIREVTTDGNINTVAGSNPPTVCAQKTDAFGDNCAATQATLNLPEAVAIDDNGNLLIADTSDALVRRVNKTTQVITVVAGGATNLCASPLNTLGDGCPATSALLSEPIGLAADTIGNIFISDARFAAVRAVNAQGVINVYAGNYSPGFTSNNVLATSTTLDEVENVAVDASGNLYIADNTTNEVRVVNSSTHIITNAAGNVFGLNAYSGEGGAATSATFFTVWGVAVSPTTGNLFVSDMLSSQVRTVAKNTGIITTFVAPTMTIPQAFIELDKQIINTPSALQTVVFTNTSGADLTISEVLVQGAGYTETDTCGDSTIPAGQSCSVFVTFTPTQVCTVDANNNGINEGVVFLEHNGPGGFNFVEFIGSGADGSGLSVSDLTNDSNSPATIAQSLVGSGVAISNITYTGAPQAAGIFSGGQNIIGFPSGVILSAGSLANVVGPNCSTGITRNNGLPGDTDLQSLLPANSAATMDAADLEFDFVPTGNSVNFRYVFASDEYNEEVGFFNDVFGFFVNGTNAALIPGTTTAVSINTVNNGNSQDSAIPVSNPQFFVNNDFQFPTAAPLDTEMDGMTVVLSVQVPVNAGVTNHIKLAIGDTGDHLFDSNVFIASGSLNSSPLRLSVGTLAFGDEAVGATSPAQIVSLTNGGSGTVDIASIVTSAGFPHTTTCGGTLPANQSCNVSVSFAPTTAGPVQGSLTVTSDANGPGTVQTVSLSGTGVTPLTILLPTSVSFPATTQNTTSGPVTVTLTNSDSSVANAILTSFTITGPFAVSAGGTCTDGGAGISPGNACTVFVTFTPTGTAPSSGTLVFEDNATGNPQTVTLSGTTATTTATVTVTPTTLTFPAQAQNTTSAEMTVTVKNTSSTAINVTFSNIATTGPFAVSGGTCSTTGNGIAQNASCTIFVTFTPTGTAASSGTLLVSDNATGSPQSVTLSGTTAAQVTTVMVTPASVTFPAQAQNTTSAPMTVTVKNTSTGSETLTFSGISASAPFAVSGGTCSTDASPLPGGSSCTILVTFTPTGTAASNGILTITDNATSGSPQTVTLHGTTAGQPTVTVTPPSLTFPATLQNTASSPMSVTVKNTSTASQTISFTNISTGEGPFSVSGGTCSTDSSPIAAGASCTIAVTFTPTGTSPSSGTLTITDNAASSPQLVPLSGTTLVPQLAVQVTPGSLTFPATLQNTPSSPMTVTVKNTSTGGGTISFSNITTGEGPFAVTGGTCSTDAEPIPAGMSCTIMVTFTPTGTSPSTGALTITDNAVNSPQNVPLNGTTLVPQTTVMVTPASLMFPPTAPGTTSGAMTVTVKNTSTDQAAIFFSDISASGPFAVSGGTCAITNDGGPQGLAVGASCTIGVTFTPTGTDPSSGALTITDNAVDSPQSVALSGTTVVPQTFTFTVGGNGGSTAIITPGDTVVFPIILTGGEGATGTVDLTCTPSTPTITCNVTPTSIPLNGTTSVHTGISVITFCTWAPPVGGPFGPSERFGDPRRLVIPIGSLLGLLLMMVLFSRANRRRWAPAMAAVVFFAVGLAGCKSLAKGPNGATPAGTYTLTLTGTLNGQSQSLPLTLIVK